MDGDNVRVVQVGDRAGLDQIRLGVFRPGNEPAVGHLDRHEALQLVVTGQVDEAEIPLSENSLNPVTADVLRQVRRQFNGARRVSCGNLSPIECNRAAVPETRRGADFFADRCQAPATPGNGPESVQGSPLPSRRGPSARGPGILRRPRRTAALAKSQARDTLARNLPAEVFRAIGQPHPGVQSPTRPCLKLLASRSRPPAANGTKGRPRLIPAKRTAITRRPNDRCRARSRESAASHPAATPPQRHRATLLERKSGFAFRRP